VFFDSGSTASVSTVEGDEREWVAVRSEIWDCSEGTSDVLAEYRRSSIVSSSMLGGVIALEVTQ
jgi:hypothetical protein